MKLLFDNFDLLAESPGGIKKLREMILQFAVQGKLVPQDPRDEPAGVLLSKIKMEKERLVKEGKIKKQKPLELIKMGEIPFELPEGWEFVRLGDVTNRIGSGSTPRGGQNVYTDEGIPFLRSQNIWNHGLALSHVAYIPEAIHKKMSNTKVLPNDILLNITGASLGRCAIYPNSLGEANVSQHVSIIRPTNIDTNIYLHMCILSPYTQDLVWSRQVGMAREGLSKKVLELFEIPLPPLTEQKRIVSKVDSLMALCDELEKKQKEKALKKLTLNKAFLHTLHNSTTKQNFTKNWNHITNNFDLLYSTPENVKELKQTILQLAVQGKLVPQDPNDEPAGVLLERIRMEKERFVKEGKIKKQKPLEPIKESEIPFELPEGWENCRLGTLTKFITDGKHGDCKNESGSGFYFISAKDIQNGFLHYNNARQIAYKDFSEVHKRTNLQPGDLCIVNTGATVGKMAIAPFNELTQKTTFQKSVAIVKLFKKYTDVKYMEYLMLKSSVELKEKSGGSAINNLLLSDMRLLCVSLPPLPEQKRIVSKVDSLMALCDQLGDNLSNKEKMSGKMLSAVVSGL